MKRAVVSLLALSALTLVQVGTTLSPAAAQGAAAPTLVNFQGRLATSSGNPVPDGTYSILFSLYDALTGGTLKWSQTVNPVAVKNGTFAVLLNTNTAGLFNGNVWLEIKIGTAAPLTPRQQIVSVPYALKANSVPDGSIGTTQLANGSITSAKFASNLFNSTAWLLSGNSGTTPATQFLGTTDNQPLVFKVNGRQALRLTYVQNTNDPNASFRSINVIGGSELNTIAAGVIGATIAGGGSDSFTDVDYPNRVDGDFGTVAGGLGNSVNGAVGFIGGGAFNIVGDLDAVVAGGSLNNAAAVTSTIGGGIFNFTNAQDSTIAGGNNNSISGLGGAIGGGNNNVAGGNFSTIPGGQSNQATGNNSFAAGFHAQAVTPGTFVWADNSMSTNFTSTGDNQFLIRASGGVGINTNDPAGYALNVDGAANFSGNIVVNGTTYTSDARFKQNIALMDTALDTLLRLRGVSYDWNKAAFPGRNFADGRQMGFLAQEVEQVFPQLVHTDRDGYKSVNYIGVIPVAVEAIKAQQKEIDTLKARLDALTKRLYAMETHTK